jgi:hypothetical protein
LKNLGIGSALSSPLSSGLPYSFWVEASSTPVNTDFEDGALEGIIFISAAGNDSTLIDNPGGPNYNNRLYLSTAPTTPIYINRGGTPNEARIKSNNVQNTFLRSGDKACIIVGATSAFAIETKSYFSNNGPAVDVFAPGENIISAAYDTNITNMRDPRVTGSDPQKLFGKVLDKGYGTSYAAPQVCGMLACALELYPNMDTKLALNYINNRMSVSGKLDPNNLFAFSNTRFSELLGAPNRSARFFEERNSQFEIYPKKNYFIRNIEETGVLYPRTRNKNF